MDAAGIEPSLGSVGDSYDNAMAETIDGLYKAEVIHHRTWKTLQEVELATLDWVDGFNHKRLLGPIGNIPPAGAEAAYDRQQVALPMAARLAQNGLRDFRGGSRSPFIL